MNSHAGVEDGACACCARTRHVRLLTAAIRSGCLDSDVPSSAQILAVKRSLNALLDLSFAEDDVWDAPVRSALRRFRDYPSPALAVPENDDMLFETPAPAAGPIEHDGVFEGGGAKGTAFLGALAYMEMNGLWFRRVAGTSAGSITAALIAAGYRARGPGKETIEHVVMNTDYKQKLLDYPDVKSFTDAEIQRSELFKMFGDTLGAVSPLVSAFSPALFRTILEKSGLARALLNLTERGGFFAGSEFRAWLNGLIQAGIQAKTGKKPSAEPSFKELYAATGIGLTVFSADLGSRQTLVLNAQTQPNMPVALAVRMSMSIPLIFSAVSEQSCTAVDGGIYYNFPLSIFTTDTLFLKSGPGDRRRPKVGFLLAEGNPTLPTQPPCPAGHALSGMPLLMRQFEAFAFALAPFNPCPGQAESIEAAAKNVVRIDVHDVGTLEFDMATARKREVAQKGWNAAAAYFNLNTKVKSPYFP